ncbi:MAG: AbrB/MazE/SpoVT family DNA-binding domain-containing protein [Clostridia bacterium]|nr:AbrB/MazE/SpoVT family DNA-binding domain-containing protein [Clostridia bacterium]
MEKYVITREMDKLGRIVIPADMRKHFGFNIGDKIQIVPAENGILLISEK